MRKDRTEDRPGSLIPGKSLQHFPGEPRTWHPKVFIKTFGCQMNSRDSEALLGLFLDKSYKQAGTEEEADIILINTCSVRQHAEDRAISYAGSLKKIKSKGPSHTLRHNKSDNIIIGLVGCMARNRGEEIFKKMAHIDLICGPVSLAKIPAYIEKIQKEKTRVIDLDDGLRDEELYRAAFRMEPEQAQVIISTGCSNFCSYCVVPYVRGKLRLRSPEDIVAEVKRNIDLGLKKITLLGQNVNDYEYGSREMGHGRGVINFVSLLKMVDAIEGVEEISFITSQPRNTTKELFTFMAKSSKMKNSLHLPFQSGSDRILKLMQRGYSCQKYLSLVDDYRRIVGGQLSTDVIVGFPTETDKDFEQTKEILEKVRFKGAYIFKYSPRSRAQSAKLVDDVSEEVKKKRHRILLDLQKRISLGS